MTDSCHCSQPTCSDGRPTPSIARNTIPVAVDVCVAGGGTLYLFLLLTPEARAWVEQHVSEDRQMLGAGLAVEHRYAVDLAQGMQSNGLTVEYQR